MTQSDSASRASAIAFADAVTREQFLRGAGAVGLSLSAGGLLAACSSDSSSGGGSGGAPQRGGELRIGFAGGGVKETLDPGLQVGPIDAARAANLFDTLFRVEAGNKLSNELAESFEPNSDATVWTVRLRKGVTWHDGKPLTADDLIYTIKRTAAPKSKYVGASALANVDVKAIKKLDPLTVEIPLTLPVAQMDWVFAVSSLSVIQDGAEEPFLQPVGTGPFKFKSFEAGQNSRFVRNEDYWKNPYPYVDTLTCISIPDGAARLNSLVAGRLEAAEMLTFAQAKAQQSTKQIAILESPAGVIVPITMAVDLPPFDDPRVRQAFRLIADRPQLVESAQSGFGGIGNDLFGKGQQYYNSELPQREADVEKAKFLLREAGAQDLTVTLYSSTVVAGMLESANVFAQQARAAGVTVNVKQGPADTYYSDRYLKAPFMQTQWSATPITTWMNFAVTSDAPYNETHWRRPEFDKMVRAAQAEVDESRAQTLWNDVQEVLWNDGGYLIWGTQPYLDGLSLSVRGAKGNDFFNLGNFDFRSWWLA